MKSERWCALDNIACQGETCDEELALVHGHEDCPHLRPLEIDYAVEIDALRAQLKRAEAVLLSACWEKQSECPFSVPGCREVHRCYICIAKRSRDYFSAKGKVAERRNYE